MQNKPKPIAIVYVPYSSHVSGRTLNWADCQRLADTFSASMPDYYWLVVLGYESEEIRLTVFYEKDFSEIKYEELKNLISSKVNQDVSGSNQ